MFRNFILTATGSRSLARSVAVNLVGTLLLSLAQPTMAQIPQKTFTSVEQASQALHEAVKAKDDQPVQAILGATPELTSPGNDDEDKLECERFVQKYEQMHRLVHEADGSVALPAEILD